MINEQTWDLHNNLSYTSHSFYIHPRKANNQLTGTIPTELGKLTALKAMNVGNNIITGSIPVEMGNLSEMQYLSLGKATIRQIASNVQCLVCHGCWSLINHFVHLCLTCYEGINNLGGKIPTVLGNLKALQSFNIGKMIHVYQSKCAK